MEIEYIIGLIGGVLFGNALILLGYEVGFKNWKLYSITLGFILSILA